MEELIGISLGLFFFICTVSAYLMGFRHAKQMDKGIAPELNLNPVKALNKAIEQKETKKEEAETRQELDEILNYSKDKALEAIKRGEQT